MAATADALEAGLQEVELTLDEREFLDSVREPAEYGKHETIPVRTDQLITLSQVRLRVNPELATLRESIANNGLLNQIDIAVLGAEPLGEYINFVNRLWGSNKSLEDFTPDENGNYFLVIAGHSRLEAIVMNEEEKAKKAQALGVNIDPGAAVIHCKIHAVKEPSDILSIQIDENIHKEPAEERRAVAIVEMYRYGQELGWWNSKKQFLEHEKIGGKFGRADLDRAILFHQYPEEIRNLILQGRYKYGVAIEIARLRPKFEDYLCEYHFKNDPELIAEHADEIKERGGQEVVRRLETARTGKWSITKARKAVQGQIKEWQATLEADRQNLQPTLVMTDPTEEWRARLALDRRAYREVIAQITEEGYLIGARAVELACKVVTDEDEQAEIKKQVRARTVKVSQSISEVVLGETLELDNGSGSTNPDESPTLQF